MPQTRHLNPEATHRAMNTIFRRQYDQLRDAVIEIKEEMENEGFESQDARDFCKDLIDDIINDQDSTLMRVLF